MNKSRPSLIASATSFPAPPETMPTVSHKSFPNSKVLSPVSGEQSNSLTI